MPTVVLGFNRPEKLAQVLAALRPQGVERLIAIIDGPRDEADRAAVESCRSLVRRVDWADVEPVLHERNRGCAGVPADLDRVFERYPAAIIVEDDCMPMPSFHDFLRQGLHNYRREPRIFSLYGYQILPRHHFRGYAHSAVGASPFRCWGWATWRDRWQAARELFPRFADLFDGMRRVPESEDPTLPALARQAALGRADYWDVMLSAICLHSGWVNMTPTHGLVRNTGVGTAGAHSVRTPPLIHNRNVTRHRLADYSWPAADDSFAAYRAELGRYLRRALRYRGRYRALVGRLERLWPLAGARS